MNETPHTERVIPAPWLTSDPRERMADGSIRSGSGQGAPETAPPANAAQGPHDAFGRLTDRAQPTARPQGGQGAAGQPVPYTKTAQRCETTNVWAEDLRTTVRSSPLALMAAAFALGAVMARITR